MLREFTSVMLALRSRGLCGADVRLGPDDWQEAAVPSWIAYG